LHGYTKSSARAAARAAAKYLESSQTLQKLHSCFNGNYQELPVVISLLFQSLSRNTSVTELSVDTESVRFASVTFQELLTCTQTLQKLKTFGCNYGDLDAVQIAAITSGSAVNTTLRDLDFQGWREADKDPVLTAL
jgi:hypothetical protein